MTRFERELQGTRGYDFDINSCKITGQRPLQGTPGNTRDTRSCKAGVVGSNPTQVQILFERADPCASMSAIGEVTDDSSVQSTKLTLVKLPIS